jgi:Protein of unknown function (DUF2934)
VGRTRTPKCTNVKELKLPPNNPVGQRAYDAVEKAAEGEIVSFTYDFPKPGTKAPVPKETLEARIGKQARARANSVSAVPFWYPLKPEGFNLLLTKPRPSMKPLNTRGSSMDQALMVRIRERAYHIWEESGGHADDNWLQAETEILQLGMPPTSLPSIPKEQRSRSNRVRAPGTGTKRFLSRAAL